MEKMADDSRCQPVSLRGACRHRFGCVDGADPALWGSDYGSGQTAAAPMDNNNQKQMLANTQAKTGVVDNEAYSDRLENIQRNLVATGLIKRNYDVYANPSKELNAFETIGGVISVNKGMLDALNDDELAFTMCHEMQHGEKRHAINGVLKSIGISTLIDVSLGGNADVLDILLGSVAVNYIDNEFVTMDQEKQADATGFNVFKNTAYNVGGAASSMQYVYEHTANCGRKASSASSVRIIILRCRAVLKSWPAA